MSAKMIKILESLQTLTSTELNFKNLRTKIHNVQPPLIPFPGIYQGDLVSGNLIAGISRNIWTRYSPKWNGELPKVSENCWLHSRVANLPDCKVSDISSVRNPRFH
jgi:hypothetical protein